MFETFLSNGLSLLGQGLLLVFLAPFIQGIIKKTKCLLQSRKGASVWQPYYDLCKYFSKEALISQQASLLTRLVPYLVLTVMIITGMLVPAFSLTMGVNFGGDAILVIYLLGLSRFLTALAALDAGGSFGAMGSSREMALATMIEPALFLAIACGCALSHSLQLTALAQSVIQKPLNLIDPSYGLAFLAMLIVVIAETGRIPLDNPDTHLELTMIHEGMVLEYSGRYLGLMELAGQIKQIIVLNLLICVFLPWGMTANLGIASMLPAMLIYLLKLVGLALLLGIIETSFAKIRLFKAPRLLASSIVLSLLAITVQAFI